MRRFWSARLLGLALFITAALGACAAHAPPDLADQNLPECSGHAPGTLLNILKNGSPDLTGCSVILESVTGAPPVDLSGRPESGQNRDSAARDGARSP